MAKSPLQNQGLASSEPTESSSSMDSPLPDKQGLRLFLIGTELATTQLAQSLAQMQPTPQIVGIIHPPLDTPAKKLDPNLFDLILLTMPAAKAQQTADIIAQLDRLALPWRLMPMLIDQIAGRRTLLRATPPPATTITHKAGTAGPGPPSSPSHSGSSAHHAGQTKPRQKTPQHRHPLHAGSIDPAVMLQRNPRPLDDHAIGQIVRGQVVMVTGAGGSIGSQLAHTLCRYKPSRLVLLERSENALFEIDRQLTRVASDIKRACILHDVTDAPRTRSVMALQKPALVFHAAAHKHVPMMEDHPADAIENNFYGTRSIADAAHAVGVDRLVMISTDKAVNPSSVMGATKRLAELYIQHLNSQSNTIFSMVRFGNVLGSACSVLPIWTRQLLEGGPITVTDEKMQRYFMTIPEAAGLVLQSAALSASARLTLNRTNTTPQNADTPANQADTDRLTQGGEIYLLDMGQPIIIMDLAKRFIAYHGLQQDADIAIQITGIRPGEKLYEELVYDSEDIQPTSHASISQLSTLPPMPAMMNQVILTFDRMRQCASKDEHLWQRASKQAILTALHTAVPEMIQAAAG